MALRRSLRLPWAIARPGRRRWMVWCFDVPAGGRICVMGASGDGQVDAAFVGSGGVRAVLHGVSGCAPGRGQPRLWITCWCAPTRAWTPRAPRPCCAGWCRGSTCMLAWPSFRAGSAVASRSPEPCCVAGGAVILDEPFTGLDAAARDATRRGRARPARRSHALARHARCRRRSGPRYLGHHHALNTN